jgi:hypothetical protein
LATLFAGKDFICSYYEKCPCHNSQENKEPLLCSAIPKGGIQFVEDKDNIFYTYAFLVDEE